MGTRDVIVASVAATVGAAVVFGLGIGLKEANSSSSVNTTGICLNGSSGVDGAQGTAGPSGAPGTNGTNGEDGAQGSAGPSGAPGTNGTNGTNGVDGVDGVCNASTLAAISGNVVPAVDNYYTLGLPDYRWKSLQLGPGTIYIQDTTTGAQAGIAVDNGSILINGADSLRIGNVRLTSTGLESVVSGQDISIGNRGDLGFLVPSRGIKFPDGTTQTSAQLQGPAGPQGAQGIQGVQGPVGPAFTPVELPYTLGGGTISGTQPTFNGAPMFYGAYVRSGATVFFNVTVVMTNITGFGTGQYFVTLPFASKYGYSTSEGRITDTSSGHDFTLHGYAAEGSNVLELTYDSGSQQVMFDHNSPVTLTTSDVFVISGTYIPQ